MLLLPFLALAGQTAAERAPTALRKLAPDANEKIFPEHLAFATLDFHDAAIAARNFLDAQDASLSSSSSGPRAHRPAFARHFPESESTALRRAAEALALLQRRGASCPSGMSGCASVGLPNKCCQDGTVCTKVDDSSVGGVACCPHGDSCGGRVGACPPDATSCPAELGGGCCIPGYVCQGMGCVPSASATTEATTSTRTVVATSTHDATQETITTTKTTWVDGAPSTVIVTQIVTLTSTREPTTKTRTKTETVTETGTGTVTGGAPWRPTGSTAESSSSRATTTEETSTQEGCPTGFYGCLATHGGGCCQTDRNCQTHSCPPQSSTTIVSDGRTIVVAASDVPTATSTCASGWFMCGSNAGARPGCCPSGYDCGTASCFTVSASQTESVQKEQPKKDAGATNVASFGLLICVAAVAVACNVMG